MVVMVAAVVVVVVVVEVVVEVVVVVVLMEVLAVHVAHSQFHPSSVYLHIDRWLIDWTGCGVWSMQCGCKCLSLGADACGGTGRGRGRATPSQVSGRAVASLSVW